MLRADVARLVDHTLLTTDATPKQVLALLAEAMELGAYSICVSPSMLPVVIEQDEVAICTVVGFPSGKHHAGVKAVEAARAVVDGATEIDMVIDIGLLKADRADLLQQEIEAVRRAAPAPAVLKVIIESAALTNDEIVIACEAAAAAGADFVKTSTGFHAAGGASVEAVRLMRETVGDRLGVKASGGIRDAETAFAMIEAGANRLGMSATAGVLHGWDAVRAAAAASGAEATGETGAEGRGGAEK
ncbi:deoxyribose-phosphate aldolase [Pseudoclavibacter endophyticus]|uniref:Deoxyribose-phosphate aldolase n=1 Tax=Pseudoclavibacter endophyticus TaxID=1778590 RepID=A0A6H9WMM9_9MICO|nr:deoxyribose-phosphate aldolase [Pseudoclavibacter endophyticus]